MSATWSEWVTASLGAWVVKGAVSLGLGIISYTGFDAMKGALDSAVNGALGNLSADLYQVMGKAGFIDAIGIWLGAFTVAVSLLAFRRLGVLNA